MSALDFLLPWDSQPQEPAELDRDGLGKGVQMLLMPMGGRLVDLVNPAQIWTPSGNATTKPTAKGIAASVDGVDDYWSTTGYPNIVGLGTFFIWLPRVGAMDSSGSVMFGSNSGASSYFQLSSIGVNYVFAATITSAADLTNSINRSFVGWSNGTGGGSNGSFVDGVANGSAAASATAFASGSKNFNFGRWIGGSFWDCDLDSVIAGFTTEVWTARQARQFHDDPFSIFAPRTIWVPVSAGGGEVSGTLATTNANDTAAANGTTTIVGTLATTNANDTSAANGTTTILGTVAATNTDDTCAASGTVGSSGTTGTVAYTNADDTAAATGTTTVTGTVARSNVDDSVSASGWVGAITGTLNVTNANDTAQASGTATGGVQTGGGGYLPSFRRKTRKEIHAERVRLGILPEQIRKAAQKVVEKAAEQGDPQEVYEDNTERYRAMFLREVGATKWAPDYARAIRIQLELMERDAEDALLLM